MRPSISRGPSRPLRRLFHPSTVAPSEPPGGRAQLSILIDGSLDTQLLFAVSGEVDLATAGELELPLQAALVAGCRHAVVDLSAVTFCGAAGLDVFARACEAFERAGGAFALTGPGAPLTRYLHLVGLGSLISPNIPLQCVRPPVDVSPPRREAAGECLPPSDTGRTHASR